MIASLAAKEGLVTNRGGLWGNFKTEKASEAVERASDIAERASEC